MNTVNIRMWDDEVRRERLYVLLLAAFLLGAAGGACFCASMAEKRHLVMAMAITPAFGKRLLSHALWCLVPALMALTPYGTGLIPLLFAGKGFLLSCRVTGVLLFSETAGLYEVLLLYLPELLGFLLVGSLIGECGMENALALMCKRPALHEKNLYVLVNRRTACRLLAVVAMLMLETAVEVLLVPKLL